MRKVKMLAFATVSLVLLSALPAAAEPDDETGDWFATDVVVAASADLPRAVSRIRYAALDVDQALQAVITPQGLAAAQEGERVIVPKHSDVSLTLFDGTQMPITVNEVAVTQDTDRPSGKPTVEVLGEYRENNEAEAGAVLTFVPDASGAYTLFGTIDGGAASTVEIRQYSDSTYMLQKMNPAEFPDHQHQSVSDTDAPVAGAAPPVAAVPDNNALHTVEVVVGYMSALGDMRGEIEHVVRQTNQALAISNANVRVRLVGTMPVPYSQKDLMEDDQIALIQGRDGLAVLKEFRESRRADLVALIVLTNAGKGACGWGSRTTSAGNPEFAYSVTALTCFSGYTFTHELGHNLGANHDYANSDRDDLPFSYSYGHRVEGTVRDVMSYSCDVECPRNLQFSNPGVKFTGFPALASGTSTANNALSITNMGAKVSAYRQGGYIWDVPYSYKFYTEIRWLMDQKIATGYADGSYRPAVPVTREAMAAFLYRYAGSPAFTPPAKSPFSDVPKTHKFYKEITWLASQKITTGNADGTFTPETAVTREAMAAFLYRFAGSPSYTPPAKSPFSDVPKTHKFYKQITWLASQKITTGNADGTFTPETAVTREAMAAFLYRYFQKYGR